VIPHIITKQHVLQAIERINEHGVPSGRRSRKYFLRHEGEDYPPKYVVALACEFATGKALASDQFGGGAETNGFLARLGFTVVDEAGRHTQFGSGSGRKQAGRGASASAAAPAVKRSKRGRRSPVCRGGAHDERCARCKETVRKALAALYGSVQERKTFDVPALLDHLLTCHGARDLEGIWDALCSLRGRDDFVKAARLPHCDYFVPTPGFVVEFDESQHFTTARKEALARYPGTLPLGFDKRRWLTLCEQIDARDNDPVYRDEQRAWYDTLRDFLPWLTTDLLPTVRIHAAEMPWCLLDPSDAADRALLRDWLGLPTRFSVEARLPAGETPFWARAIIKGPWYGGTEQASRLLEAVCASWPQGLRARILVTCGGFVSFRWPESISRATVRSNLSPEPRAVEALFEEADRVVERLLTSRLRSELAHHVDAVTLGVDSLKTQVSLSDECIHDLHVELVYLVDLRTGHRQRTGKSYPTVGQAPGLVRIADLSTHFAEFDGEAVLLLGCHDLAAFNPRGNAVAKGWRRELIRDFHQAVRDRRPGIVAQHPHTTDTKRIWGTSWGKLVRVAPSIHSYASAGRYYNGGDPCRGALCSVLSATVRGESLDFAVTLSPS